MSLFGNRKKLKNETKGKNTNIIQKPKNNKKSLNNNTDKQTEKGRKDVIDALGSKRVVQGVEGLGGCLPHRGIVVHQSLSYGGQQTA